MRFRGIDQNATRIKHSGVGPIGGVGLPMSKVSKSSVLAATEAGSIRLDTDVCSETVADVREYIGDMAAGLAELASASRLDALAAACHVVREIAEGNVTIDTRIVGLS
jgi:hypothetical protein